jgi:small subunit ribosomal protein S20
VRRLDPGPVPGSSTKGLKAARQWPAEEIVSSRRSITLANHKSALKRNRQSQQRRLRNRMNRTQVKHVIRKVNEAIAMQSAEEAQEALMLAIPVIDRAAVKGAIHKKNASRKVSRLTRKVNSLATPAQSAS